MNNTMQDSFEKLQNLLGPDGWTRDPDRLRPHLEEWRGQYHGETPLMIMPASVEETAQAVRLCAEAGQAITPQGGNTGLVGGQMPQGEILLSLSRQTLIRSVNPLDNTICVEAGVTLKTIQEEACKAGRLFPLSLASEGSATAGGAASTNAGGVHVVRYGMMRDLVLGLEVVLPDGQIWSHLKGLRKDNTGYDLKHMFIGAEGTLGIITALCLKLFPRPQEHILVWTGLESLKKAPELLHFIQEKSSGNLSMFEILPQAALDLVIETIPNTRKPLKQIWPWHGLIEVNMAEGVEAQAFTENILSQALDKGLIRDAVLAQNETQKKAFYRLRESLSEAQKKTSPSLKYDISLPLARLEPFFQEATHAIQNEIPEARPLPFGHVGDGNLHFNILPPPGMDSRHFMGLREDMDTLIYDLVEKHGGSLSAEHGIGLLKKAELQKRQSPVGRALMLSLKQSLDPHNIMNPRVLF